jgi:hypothetical protein
VRAAASTTILSRPTIWSTTAFPSRAPSLPLLGEIDNARRETKPAKHSPINSAPPHMARRSLQREGILFDAQGEAPRYFTVRKELPLSMIPELHASERGSAAAAARPMCIGTRGCRATLAGSGQVSARIGQVKVR